MVEEQHSSRKIQCKHPLYQARQLHNLTQQELAEATSLSLATIKRVERGVPIGTTSRKLLCEYFQSTPKELGLVTHTHDSSATTLESDDMKRREFMNLAGIISGAFLTVPQELLYLPQLWEHAAKTVSSVVNEETLPLYQSQLELCWHLSEGKDLHAIEQVLPVCLPAVLAATQDSTPLRKQAARLASMGYQLSYVLASNKDDFSQALTSCQKAYQYATLAVDPELQVLSLIREGVVYLIENNRTRHSRY